MLPSDLLLCHGGMSIEDSECCRESLGLEAGHDCDYSHLPLQLAKRHQMEDNVNRASA